MDNQNQRPHLSVSQISKYLSCGIQYYYRYILKVPPQRAPTEYMLHGSSVDHSANEHFGDIKVNQTTGLDNTAFVEQAVEYHDTNVDDHELMNHTKDASRDQVWRMSNVYHQTHAQAFKPKEVQYKFQVEYSDTTDFIGYADLITADGKIIDNKISKRVTLNEGNAQNSLSNNLQLVKYADMYGSDEVGLAIVSNTKEPRAYYFQASVSPKDKERLNNVIKRVYEGITKEVFTPPPEGSWWCSAKWCDYWNICEFGGKRYH